MLYKVGYIPGSFDLFHVGHLNLIRRAKEKCEFLIVGVCTDELVEFHKGRKPVISFEDRLEIVNAIRYVDRAVKVDFSNTDKIDAWKMFKYDCHFAGSDHIDHWLYEREFLKKQNVHMEFFDYTEKISTTKIREQMSNH